MLSAAVYLLGVFSMLVGGPLAPIGHWFSDNISPILDVLASAAALPS